MTVHCFFVMTSNVMYNPVKTQVSQLEAVGGM